MTNPILEQARGQWPYILESGGIVPSYLQNKHGPCPICGGKDRFRFDNKEGRGTFICTQCGAGNGIKLLQLYREYNFKDALDFIEGTLNGYPKLMRDILKKEKLLSRKQEGKNRESRRSSLNYVWSQSQPITADDPVDRYLKARSIKLEVFPKNLRYHSNLPYYDNDKIIGKFPAMLALVKDQHNKTITIHRTYLGDGCKANVPNPKKLMSPVLEGSSLGGAIRLYPPTEDGTLAIAEGIETALAFYVMTGFPVWATVSALGMERIILPPEINNVWIAMDNDHSGTGQKAAAELASLLVFNGQKVRCVMPPNVGDDFADLLLEVEE